MRRAPAERAATRAAAGPLLSHPTVEPATARLQTKSVAGFVQWLRFVGVTAPLAALVLVPALLDRAVESYGNHLYGSNVPVYVFISLVTSLQRLEPALRHKLAHAWDLAARWNRLEPTEHRVPVPAAVVKALVVGALAVGWPRWAGVTLLTFYGPARIGEVLRARRGQLLLAADTLGEMADRSYLHVMDPKSRNRGGARQQHVLVKDVAVVRFLERVFGKLAPDEALYPFSAAAYRKRWDRLLAALSIPRAVGLAPGGLRGGGAVSMYMDDLPVSELQWRMRLQSMQTLEYYLQEVAALTTLQGLEPRARAAVQFAAGFFAAVISN